jgi:cation-transporting ATPase E
MATVYSAQTTLTTFFVLAGVMLMVFAAPPIKWLAGGAPYRGKNWLPTIAAVVLIVAYIIVLLLPGFRSFFDLVPLPPVLHISVAALTVLWVLAQRAVWRSRWFEKFLDLEESIGVE